MTRLPTRFVEAGLVAVVALWLVHGLLSSPAVLSAVLTFAALPLLLVVLPALLVRAVGDDPVRFRVPLPWRAGVSDGTPDDGTVAMTDGGPPERSAPDER